MKFQEGFIYEDLPYFYEVYTQAEKVILVNEFLYSYRVNNQNSTMTRTDKNVKDRVDMASRAYDVLKKQKYFEEIKSNVLNTMIHDLFYRCLIIDSRYQKEYFFRMQKFFKTLDTTGVDDTLIKSRYYPHFCEIKKRSYEEIVKYFFNQETLGAAYVEHAKKVFKRDFDDLELKKRDFLKEKEFLLGEIDRERSDCEREKSENAKNVADLKKSKSELDKLWKDFEKSKKSKLAELDRLQAKILQDEKKRYAEFEKQNESKNADFERQKGEIAQEWAKIGTEREKRLKELTDLQDKILQDEKTRWADFEQKNNKKKEEFAAQQADLDVEWQKLETEKAEQDDLISAEWKKIENERIEQAKLIETEWEKFEKEKAERVALIELEWKKFDKEKAQRVALLEAEWKKFEKEKSEQTKLVEDEWKKIDEEKSEQAKLVEDEWKKIEAEWAEQTGLIEAERKKLEEEKVEQSSLIESEWKRLETEKTEKQSELDNAWAAFKADDEKHKVETAKAWEKLEKEYSVKQTELDKAWKNLEIDTLNKQIELDKAWKDFAEETKVKQAEVDAAWEKFKQDTAEREKNLDVLQDRILSDEKERWKKFEDETALKKAELQEKEAELIREFDLKKQNLNKLEDELWQKVNARQEELKKGEYELDKAWEKFKIDNLTREKELDNKQSEILSDEKERWKKYELQVAEFERKKVEFDKEKELMLKEIDRQWADFEKEKQSQLDEIERQRGDLAKEKQAQLDEIERQRGDLAKEKQAQLDYIEHQRDDFAKEKQAQLDEIEHQRVDFEKEKEFQLCEIDRRHKFEKLTVEKTKNYLSNRYLTEIEEEKTKLAKHYAEEVSGRDEYFADLLKQQLRLQEENYKKTDIFKEKVKDDMINRPKVSIILPVYNVAPYLRQSLDSIIAQTLSDIEIICVDDGSTDESGKILDEYKEKDARIKVIHKKNAGTGAARNDGLRIATGECIGFVDPDDWILPNMYERLYNILQDKELDIVMFTPDVFNDQTQKHEGFLYFQDSNFPKFLDDKIFNKDDISPFSYPMCVWNKLYRKKLFDDNNIDFAEGLDFEDHKVIFKSLFTAKRIYFIREKLYVYRHSRQGSILSDNDTRMFDHIKIYDIVENILKETGNWEKFHLDFLRYKVHNILYYYTMIKPQYKEEYYKKMVKSLQNTRMSEEEFETLAKDYPELKPIMGDTLVNKLKNAVKKIIKG